MDTPHGDDQQVGHVLSRREIVASLGAAGVALASGGVLPGGRAGATGARRASRLPACIVRPEQTEGPYFTDVRLNRSDIRSDPADGTVKEGVPLLVTFQVSRVDGASCAPLAGAMVDLWQCDALGVYSDVRDFQGLFDTRGQRFLRGHQLTDAAGRASFRTIYPGWYVGRTVHLHFKIRTDPEAPRGYDFTSQLYFDEAVSDRVFTRAPYASKVGRRTRNAQDGIFRRGGDQLLLPVAPHGDGYAGTFEIGLQMA
jgi:protocatechuate 3,4-dioxygenase beta subunit